MRSVLNSLSRGPHFYGIYISIQFRHWSSRHSAAKQQTGYVERTALVYKTVKLISRSPSFHKLAQAIHAVNQNTHATVWSVYSAVKAVQCTCVTAHYTVLHLTQYYGGEYLQQSRTASIIENCRGKEMDHRVTQRCHGSNRVRNSRYSIYPQ